MTLHRVVNVLLFAASLSSSGCVAPHYTNRQLILFGKAAPAIETPDDPALRQHLSVQPQPKLGPLAVISGFATTPFKCLGLQGWKDYHIPAKARGTVVQNQVSSDRFFTVDLRLNSLEVNRVSIPLPDRAFIRLEIFLGKVPVDRRMITNGATLVATGKFAWDADGWFEIHPQEPGDVRRETDPN